MKGGLSLYRPPRPPVPAQRRRALFFVFLARAPARLSPPLLKRTGVPTTISGRARRATACAVRLSPPTTRATRTSVNWASLPTIPATWTASSRAGVRMSPYVAARLRGRCRRRSRRGRAKAAVLPEPVMAEPAMSRPSRASGMQAA